MARLAVEGPEVEAAEQSLALTLALALTWRQSPNPNPNLAAEGAQVEAEEHRDGGDEERPGHMGLVGKVPGGLEVGLGVGLGSKIGFGVVLA